MLLGAVRQGVGGAEGLDGIRHLAVAPDGAHVYTSGDLDNRLGRYTRDATTGLLAFLGSEVMDGPRGLVLSPGGEHLYVGTTTGPDRLFVFERTPVTGALTLVETHQEGVGGVNGIGADVTLSSDGAHVYTVSAAGNHALAVFSRDATTGALTLVEVHQDGVGGVDGLANAQRIVLSPDDAHAYVAGKGDNAIAVFSRDATTGALTFVEIVQDGVGGVEGLLSVNAVAVSPDGSHVYAVTPDQLSVFSRNTTTGALTFVEVHKDNSIGGTIVNLGGGRDIRVSADGARVYVAASADDALNVFSRDATTGSLIFVEDFIDETSRGGTALDGASALALSADGAHIYVGAQFDDAVSVFRPIAIECSATPAAGCRVPAVAGRARLLLRDKTPDAGDLAVFKWVRGEETLFADLGDPVSGGTEYALCLYDTSGGGQPVLEALAPAGGVCPVRPCWKATAKVVRYQDKTRTPSGMLAVRLLPGMDGKAKVIVKAKGEELPLPALPLALPVTVQVQASTGACWAATFSTALENSPEVVRARAD